MDDGCISIFNLEGLHILTNRNSKSEILSLNYIVDRHQIRAFNADKETLLFTDIKRSSEIINLRTRMLISKAGTRFNRGYVKGLVNKVKPDMFETFVTKQGISLHSLCLLCGLEEEFEYLVETIGLEEHGMLFKEDFHPVEIAIDLVNFRALELISRHIEKNNSLLITESLLFKALESPSSTFKKAVVEAYTTPPGLDRTALPSALSIDPEEFPYILQSFSKNLEQKDINRIKRDEEKSGGEQQIFEYYRVPRPISLHLSSNFIRQFLRKMMENSELCATTQSKSIIIYLWRQYKIYAWLYAFMFITFAVNTFIGLIWCTNVDKCETFLNTGDFTIVLLIINRVIMYALYLVIVFFEFLVIFKLGLGYFNNLYNILDSLILIVYLPMTILIFADFWDDGENLANNLYTGFLFLLGLRALLQLRVIDRLRYLIAMILNVFTDMIPFLTILISAITIIACLEINTNKSIEEAGYEGTFSEFLKKIDGVYNVGFGNWDGQDQFPYHLYILYLF